jgi:hypothetical protein
MSTRAEFRSLIIGEYEISERFWSKEESTESVDVYYVPAERDAAIRLDGGEVWLGISGANKPRW